MGSIAQGVRWVVMSAPAVIGRLQLNILRDSVATATGSKVKCNHTDASQPYNISCLRMVSRVLYTTVRSTSISCVPERRYGSK